MLTETLAESWMEFKEDSYSREGIKQADSRIRIYCLQKIFSSKISAAPDEGGSSTNRMRPYEAQRALRMDRRRQSGAGPKW